MTEQLPTLNNPTLPATVPANDIDQIRLNVATTGTGDTNLRNLSIPGRFEKNRKSFFTIFCI